MPSAIGYLLSAITGLLVGAGLNVLADDLPQRRRPGAPACPHCGQALPPHFWLAVAGYLFGGRCPNCSSPIPLRRVAVELASALALAYLWSKFGPTYYFVFAAVIVEILLLVTIIDAEHRLILRIVILPGMLVALAGASFDPEKGLVRSLIGGAVGFGVTYLFYIFGRVFARAAGRMRGQAIDEVAFGWGDVNLGAFIGLAVGWPSVIFSLLVGVFAGGLAGAVWLLIMRLRGRGTSLVAMPYGPWLALGCLVMLVWAEEFVRWYFGR